MTCEEARIGLYALLDGELGVSENVEVLGHLESCALCQRECEADRRLKTLARELLSAESIPDGLWQRVAGRIRREDPSARQPGRVAHRVWKLGRGLVTEVWHVRPAWAVLAMACVFAAAIMLGRLSGGASYVVDEIVTDHVRSAARLAGPVDVRSGDPAVLLAELRQRVSLPARAPAFQSGDVKLLGGSVCHLGITKGIRLTYAVGDETLSFYHLERPAGATFPMPGAGRLSVDYVDRQHGPGLVLWADDRSLYALVGEMPAATLQRLAAQI